MIPFSHFSDPPKPPAITKIESNRKAIKVIWNVSNDSSNSPVSEYILKTKTDRPSGETWRTTTISANSSYAIVRNLHRGVPYRVRLFAQNQVSRTQQFFLGEILCNTLGGYVIVEKLKVGHKKLIVTLIPVQLSIAVEGEGGGEGEKGEGGVGNVSELKLLKVFISRSVHSALVVRRTTLFPNFPI